MNQYTLLWAASKWRLMKDYAYVMFLCFTVPFETSSGNKLCKCEYYVFTSDGKIHTWNWNGVFKAQELRKNKHFEFGQLEQCVLICHLWYQGSLIGIEFTVEICDTICQQIGSDNGLASNRWQVIIWANGGWVYDGYMHHRLSNTTNTAMSFCQHQECIIYMYHHWYLPIKVLLLGFSLPEVNFDGAGVQMQICGQFGSVKSG